MCVKHVPDAASDRRIENGRIVRGEDDVLNELDEYAIEEAVSLVEDRGGEVIALSMGPEDSEEAVFRALQMGADRGILVSDPVLEGADVPATTAVLAAAVRHIEQDGPVSLIITGMASLDGMTSMFAPSLAANLEWPLLDLAEELSVEGDDGSVLVTIKRSADGWEDTLRAATPAVVSVTDQINEPRYPSFKTMKAARSKPLDHLEVEDLQRFIYALPAADPGNVGVASTLVVEADQISREEGTVVTDSGDGGDRLAKYLLEYMNQTGLIDSLGAGSPNVDGDR